MIDANNPISEEAWKDWKRKRKNTLIGFLIISTACGIDYAAMLATLYLYLQDLVKTENPNLYYGIIMTAFICSAAISGVVCGRCLDLSRKVRLYVFICIILQILGSALYVIPIHPAFLVVGRFFSGIGDSFNSVVSGEVFRIYDYKDGTQAAFWLAITYSFGAIVGPLIVLLFKGISFKIGLLQVNSLNFIGIFMLVLFSMAFISSSFLIHDCSAQFDLKKYLKQKRDNIAEEEMSSNELPKIYKNNFNDTTVNNVPEKNDKNKDNATKILSSWTEEDGKTVDDKDISLKKSSKNDNKNPENPTESFDDGLKNDKKRFQDFKIASTDSSGINSEQYDKQLNSRNNLSKAEVETSVKVACSSSNTMQDTNANRVLADENTYSKTGLPNKKIKIVMVLNTLLGNLDTLLLLAITISFTYMTFVVDILFPLIVTDLLKWSLTSLSIILSLYGVFYFILLAVFSKFFGTRKLVYYASVICVVASIFLFSFMICLNLLPRFFARDVSLMAFFFICWLFIWCIDDALIRIILAGMVPSEVQGFAEGIRNGFGKVGKIVAPLTSAFLLPAMHWWAMTMILLVIILLILYLSRKNNMIDAKEIKFGIERYNHFN